MKKTVLTITAVLLLSSGMHAKTNSTDWSFSNWLSEGFTNVMERIEKDVQKLKEEFSKIELFGPKTKSWYDEKEKKYRVSMELPGYESIKVQIVVGKKKQELVITAEKDIEEKDEAGKIIRKEKKEFKWSEKLPENALGKETSFTYKDGILEIEIPTKEKEDVEIIEIKEKK